MKRQYINPKTLHQDISAGIVLGIESVPDGLAAGLLALVNPVWGLYGYMMGTVTGAFFTSSVFMTVQATGAMALVVASVPQVTSGEIDILPRLKPVGFLILTLEKTRLKSLGLVVAMIVSSLLVVFFDASTVAVVNDVAAIPDSLPRPMLPSLSLFPPLIIPAISLAFVGLVQGAGISKSFVNPDGEFPDASGDFVGQGVANIVAGLFQGMPVGGSMSASSLVSNAGAHSRFANICAGIVMAIVILLFGTAVGMIAMPALAGLLIVVGFRTLKPDQVRMVWKTGTSQQIVMGITFFTCIVIPLQYAVLLGVLLSVILYMVQQSNKITIKWWVRPEGDFMVEVDPPTELPSHEITLLVPYGSLFFATSALFEKQLPDILEETDRAVVILILRGDTDLGSTFFGVVERYAQSLKEHNSKLILAGVAPDVQTQLNRTGLIEVVGRGNIYLRSEYVGQSGVQAWADAERWLADNSATQPEQSDMDFLASDSDGETAV